MSRDSMLLLECILHCDPIIYYKSFQYNPNLSCSVCVKSIVSLKKSLCEDLSLTVLTKLTEEIFFAEKLLGAFAFFSAKNARNLHMLCLKF